MKNEKGITLIALVITIIVMLILVGVTVNIAINGGLFETANDATRKMEEQTIYDQIVGLTEFETNGDINIEATHSAIQAKFGAENVSELGQDGTFTVKGKNGTFKYILATSKIEVYNENSGGGGISKSKELLPTNDETAEFGEMKESAGKPVALNSSGTVYVDYADLSYLIPYYGSTAEARLVMIVTGDYAYLFAVDDTSATNYPQFLNGTGVTGLENMTAKTWYRASTSNPSAYSVYEGASTFGDDMSPISTEDFEGGTVYSTTYLTRVINSF